MSLVSGCARSGTHSHSRVVLVLVAALVTAGCSQVAAVAPVGGTREAEVRFAGNDVLVAQGVAIMAAPVCTSAGETVTCTGSTTDGATITVSAPPGERMTVTVGPRTLYDGAYRAVLEAAGRPS
jgi:hypothetical protein